MRTRVFVRLGAGLGRAVLHFRVCVFRVYCVFVFVVVFMCAFVVCERAGGKVHPWGVCHEVQHSVRQGILGHGPAAASHDSPSRVFSTRDADGDYGPRDGRCWCSGNWFGGARRGSCDRELSAVHADCSADVARFQSSASFVASGLLWFDFVFPASAVAVPQPRGAARSTATQRQCRAHSAVPPFGARRSSPGNRARRFRFAPRDRRDRCRRRFAS